ncbi:MAG: hypothetical protein WA317_00140 [Mycobacterium sp.]|uniref:hypothetical protein n=1 Tax=Mycobacterium sp. TaxID=1785 RepID=UPI003CC65A83
MPRKTNPFQQVIASLLDLLENGSVITESIEYPDPQAGNPREVDITIVCGQLNGQELKIGVECTKLGRKATQTWVDQQHGKHSRLQAAGVLNSLVLVSGSGFTGPGRILAENLGYLAVYPNITESELAAALNDRMGLRVKAASVRIVRWDVTHTLPLPSAEGFRVVDSPEEPWLFRANGSKLVRWSEFEGKVKTDEYMKRHPPSSILDEGPINKQFTVELDPPVHEGERLHVKCTDGEVEVFAVVDKMVVTLSVVSTNMADMKFTHAGNFVGHGFATGQAPIGDTHAVIVATDVDGEGKTQVRFNFDADKGHPPQFIPKKKPGRKKKK